MISEKSVDWWRKAGLNETDLKILKIIPSNYNEATK